MDLLFAVLGIVALILPFVVIPYLMGQVKRNPESTGGPDVTDLGPGDSSN